TDTGGAPEAFTGSGSRASGVRGRGLGEAQRAVHAAEHPGGVSLHAVGLRALPALGLGGPAVGRVGAAQMTGRALTRP
ncbi:hypothetical protein ACFWAJ_02320, partial [Streptomyces sp. NPDC059943]